MKICSIKLYKSYLIYYFLVLLLFFKVILKIYLITFSILGKLLFF